jgi:hypothetical protein
LKKEADGGWANGADKKRYKDLKAIYEKEKEGKDKKKDPDLLKVHGNGKGVSAANSTDNAVTPLVAGSPVGGDEREPPIQEQGEDNERNLRGKTARDSHTSCF